METVFLNRSHASDEAFPITTALNTATEIDYRHKSGGGFTMPNGTPIGTLTLYVAARLGGHYVQLAQFTGLVQNTPYNFPDTGFPWGGLKLVGDQAGTVGLALKS